MNWLPKYNYILASKSPRRQQLLKSLGLEFEVRMKEVDEIYPENLEMEKIPVFLAELKSKAFQNELTENDLLICADTIVCIHDKVLGKPKNSYEAREMLMELSNMVHHVITGVSLSSLGKTKSFYSVTKVWFKDLNNNEIDYYISTYKPFDKAGSYGIQDWIGVCKVDRIEGSYSTVMGLPIHRLYEELMKF